MVRIITQNELMRLPRYIAEHVNISGEVVPATYEEYVWFPIKRLPDGRQLVWIQPDANLGDIQVEPYLYKGEDNVAREVNVNEDVSKARNKYIESMTVKTGTGKLFHADPESITLMTAARVEALEDNLPEDTVQHWRLVTDGPDDATPITLAELREAGKLAIRKFAYVKGIIQ